MAEKFLMPKLSPTMEEGQISRWVKNEGAAYEANETLAEVDTDKATMEMTALQGGTLLKILKQAGETAALGEAIAITGKQGEDISALLSEIGSNGGGKQEADNKAPAEAEAPAPSTTVEKPEEQELKKTSAPADSPQAETQAVARVPSTSPPKSDDAAPTNGRLIVSPIAARMAADNGIDLRSVAGSGPNGRI